MAISWGGYATIGGVRLRAGVENTVSPANPSPSTSSVTVTTRIYLGLAPTSYGWGNGSWTAGDDASGSGTFSWDLSNGNHVLVGTTTTTVSLRYGQTQTFRGRGTVRPFTSYTGTVTAATTVTVPARPLSAPAAPTNASVARVNDSQQNVSWRNNASTAAPYTRIEVSRRIFNTSWSGWATINGNVSGSATSYADTSTQASRRYEYRVRAVNSAGTSAWVNAGMVHTTPAAPSGAPTAVRQGTSTIVVTRPSLVGAATHWQVEHSHVGGATATSGLMAVSQTTYSHSPSTSATHRYRARAVSGGLTGGWSPYSSTVQLLSPPNAPTHLDPNGAVLDISGNAVAVTWRHNPTDSSPQTQYRLRRRVQGTTAWTHQAIQTSSVQGGNLGPVSNGNFYEWQVQTRGEHGTFGPWSATATFTASSAPVASVVSPDGGTHIQPSIALRWGYHQDSGRPQVGWRVQIQRSGHGTVLDQSGSGNRTVWQTGNVLENGGRYAWRVQVQDSSGQWSPWSAWSSFFTVTFTPPATPTVYPSWDDEGFVLLEIDVDGGSGPTTETLTVERATDEDGPWTLIVSDLPPGSAWQDWTAPLDTELHYRVTAVSGLPSTASAIAKIVTPPTGWLYLGVGSGYSQTVRLDRRMARNLTMGRERSLRLYEGAESPVEVSGDSVPLALAVSAVVTSTGQRLALQDVFALPGPHLYRDGAQNTVLGTVSDLAVSPDHLGEIEFSIERSWEGTYEQRQAAAVAEDADRADDRHGGDI